MNTRLKNILIFIITILLAAGVYIWFYPLNKGVLSVTTGLDNYSIANSENVQCSQNPCEITLSGGPHNIKIQKDQYLTKTVNVYIKRGETSKISVELQKRPTLNVSSIIPPDKKSKNLQKFPEELKNLSILAPTWNKTGNKLAFLDLSDNRLKIWEEDKDLKLVTTLKNMQDGFELFWSPDQTYLLGNIREDIYFIDTKNASRKKHILEFSPRNIVWSLESNYLLANDNQNNLYKINFSEGLIEPLKIMLNLGNAAWNNVDTLIYFSYNQKENKTVIVSHNIATQEKKEIIEKYNFPVEKIGSDEDNAVYFYNSDLENWYKLDY